MTFNPATIFVTPVTHDECSRIIKNLKCTRQGLDSLPVKLLIQLSDYFVPALCDIINEAFFTGALPNRLKVTTVFPIYKSGNKSVLTNYRAISKLPIVSKIFEAFLTNLRSF